MEALPSASRNAFATAAESPVAIGVCSWGSARERRGDDDGGGDDRLDDGRGGDERGDDEGRGRRERFDDVAQVPGHHDT